MLIIADNLNTRNKAYMEALRAKDKNTLMGLAKGLSHADMINLQCSLDGSGDEETLPWVLEVVEEAAAVGVCLDSRNIHAIKKSLTLAKSPPLINFISASEPEDPEGLLELTARAGASLVVRASRSTPPTSIEAKLLIIEELLEMANSFDIPNERLFADPSVVHIGRGSGQRHLVNSIECIRALKELVEPPINTIAWISNVSSGMPYGLRKTIEAAFFSYASGAGLDAAMLDVLDETVGESIYLVKSFRDEVVFTQADLA